MSILSIAILIQLGQEIMNGFEKKYISASLIISRKTTKPNELAKRPHLVATKLQINCTFRLSEFSY